MKKILLVLLSVFSLAMTAQTLNHQWSFNPKNINAQAGSPDVRGIVADASGNMYVTGFFTNGADFDPGTGVSYLVSNGAGDVFFAKYSSTGSLVWAKSIGSHGGDQAYGIALDAANNVYITGYFTNTVDFDPGPGVQNRTSLGSQDAFIAKYDNNGDYVFAQTAGSPGTGNETATGIAVSSNYVYAIGGFAGLADFDPSPTNTQTLTPVGSQDIYVWKLDLNGNYSKAISLGGSSTDVANGISVDAADNVYLAGNFFGTADFDPHPVNTATLTSTGQDAYFAKYDLNLDYKYANKIGGSSIDNALSITHDGSGNIYLTGTFNGTVDAAPSPTLTQNIIATGTSSDIFYGRYDANGDYIFAYTIQGPQTETVFSVKTDANKNIYLTGGFYVTTDFDPIGTATITAPPGADAFVAKYDSLGLYVFADAFSGLGSEIGQAMYVDAAGIYVGGVFQQTVDFDPSTTSTVNLTSGTGYNSYFGRYTHSGAYGVAKHLGDLTTASAQEFANAVALDALGNTYVTGYFTNVVDFDPNPTNSYTLASTTSTVNDIFVAKYTPIGNLIWARSMGGGLSDNATEIKIDAAGNVYVAGFFSSTDADFDPSATASATFASAGAQDAFVIKLDSSGKFIRAFTFGSTGTDAVNSIKLDPSCNIYLAGVVSGTVDLDPGPGVASFTAAAGTDAFFAKYDSTGAYLNVAGVMGGGSGDVANGIGFDATGNIFVAGNFGTTADMDPGLGNSPLTSAGGTDPFFAKYSSTGALIYAKQISGPTGTEGCNDMVMDASNNLYLIGTYGSASTDFDPSPTGSVTLNFVGSGEGYFAKYDSTGALVYANGIVGSGGETMSGISVDANGNVFLCGSFGGTVDLDPGPNPYFVNPGIGTSNDIFFGKYDNLGQFLYAYTMGGGGTDAALGITTSSTNDVILCGTFVNPVDLDPNAGVSTLTSFNNQDCYVARYNCSLATAAITAQNNVLCNGGANGSATISATGGTNFTYTWSPVGGNTVTANGLTAGNYTVTSQNLCGNAATQVVTITEPAALTLNATSSSSAICANNSATLSTTGTGGTSPITYTWVSVGSGSTTVVTPTTSTVYTVTAVDNNTCTASATVALTVNANPTVTAVSSTSAICSGQTATLTAGGAVTYTWSTAATGSTAIESPTMNTTYTVTGTDANSCSADTTISLVVNSIPVVTAVSSTSVLCSGQTATFTAGGALTYTWSTAATGSVTSDAPTTTTSYTVTGTDANGCENNAVFSQSVTVCAGINGITANEMNIEVYPNPNNGVFEVALPSYSNSISISIYNNMGMEVMNVKPEGLKANFDISEMASGIYFVRIRENGNVIAQKKLIKQ